MTNVYSPMVPNSGNPLDRISAGAMDVAQNRALCGPRPYRESIPDLVRLGKFFSSFEHPDEDMAIISQPLDFYGLNYYMPTQGGGGRRRQPGAGGHGGGHRGRSQRRHARRPAAH